MGTKLNPGKFDCYANALPDEPMFVLLARDPLAPNLVSRWAMEYLELKEEGYQRRGEPMPNTAVYDKFMEACHCAIAMKHWREANPKPDGGYPKAESAPYPSDLTDDQLLSIVSDESRGITAERTMAAELLQWRGRNQP